MDLPAEIDTSKPHAARIYDYFIGGENHFAADRAAAAEVLRNSPSVRVAARENRAFLGRAVHYLAAEAGIRQLLDIGAGLPTTSNVHHVAQAAAPSSRVVYADNDPLVLSRARALLTSSPAGACDYPDTDQAQEIVGRLVTALAPGSFLAVNHSTSAVGGPATEEAVAHWNQVGTPTITLRTPEQITRFFDGLDLLEPGVVPCSRCRPDISSLSGQPPPVDEFSGVARKP